MHGTNVNRTYHDLTHIHNFLIDVVKVLLFVLQCP